MINLGKPAERASDLAWRASESAERASNPVGRASDKAERGSEAFQSYANGPQNQLRSPLECLGGGWTERKRR